MFSHGKCEKQQKIVKENDTTRHDTTQLDTTRGETTHTRTEGTGTHNQKGANAKNRNYEMYIPKLLQNTRKQFPKTSNNFQQLINNRSKMSPGAPKETPRAKDLCLRPFLLFFGCKMESKMVPAAPKMVSEIL